MKHLLVIGDGMADNPVPALGGRTPLQVANIPGIDALAAADKGHQIKAEKTDGAPVQRADDHQDQCNSICDHVVSTSSSIVGFSHSLSRCRRLMPA